MRVSLAAAIGALVLGGGARGDFRETGYSSGYDDGYLGYTEYEPPRAHKASYKPQHEAHYKPSYKPSYSYEPSYKPSYEPSYQSYCDCSKYELLGLGSGVASLATFGALLLLASVNGTGSSLLTGRELPAHWRERADQDGSLARAAVSAACSGVELVTGEATWADIGQNLVAASLRGAGGDVSWSLLGRAARLVDAWHALADRAGGPGGRSGGGGCDCFPGLAGAVTGFAALGGIAGYSLYQSNRALRAALTLAAMTTTTTTTTTTTARRLDFGFLATLLEDGE